MLRLLIFEKINSKVKTICRAMRRNPREIYMTILNSAFDLLNVKSETKMLIK